MQLVTSSFFLLLLSSSVCRTFCEENGFLCCVSNYTGHTKHTVWYSTSEPFLSSQSPRDSISLVSRQTAGQVIKYHPDTKSCWITERNPEHSKQLSASFHHHAATSQVSALKSSSSTLYWRNLRYSVCLPKKTKKHPMGKKMIPIRNTITITFRISSLKTNYLLHQWVWQHLQLLLKKKKQ